MKPIFLSRLINAPFEDPSLYVRVAWERRAFLFDLGANHHVSTARLLKVTDVFVSHTHVDHFIGFDHLLRLHVGRRKTLRFYGPPGLIENVRGKLAGYTWNLVENNKFVIEVHELRRPRKISVEFPCVLGFKEARRTETMLHETVLDEPMFSVQFAVLDHMIPSLAYALREKMHINIRKEKIEALGYVAGPWLKTLKDAIREGKPDDHPCSAVKHVPGGHETITLPLGLLKEQLVLVSKGQKIAYVVDAAYSPENREKILGLVMGADLLYCEATFSEEDADKGLEKYHLTAGQAGRLAREAEVGQLVIFHFSPKYVTEPMRLYREAAREFPNTFIPSRF